jgi:hypothetical protein
MAQKIMDKKIIHQLHGDFERCANTDEATNVEYWCLLVICKKCSDMRSGGILSRSSKRQLPPV